MDDKTQYEVTTDIEHGDGYSRLVGKIEPKWTKELCEEPPRPSISIIVVNNQEEWIVETTMYMVNHFTNNTGRARVRRSQVYNNESIYHIDDNDVISHEKNQLEEFMPQKTVNSETREEQLEKQAKNVGELKKVLESFTEQQIKLMTDLSHHDR